METEDVLPPPESLYNWTSPEILLSIAYDEVDGVAMRENDVYSLCCLIWEMCTGQVPWSKYKPQEILQLVSNGYTLKLDRNKMPTLLFRVMRQGLIWNIDDRDLDLTEIRDMLLMSRHSVERAVSDTCSSTGTGSLPGQEGHHHGVSRSKITNDVSKLVKPSDLQKFSKSALQSDLLKMSKDFKTVPELVSIDVPDNDSVTESNYSSCYSDLDQIPSQFPSGSNLNFCKTSHLSGNRMSTSAARSDFNAYNFHST